MRSFVKQKLVTLLNKMDKKLDTAQTAAAPAPTDVLGDAALVQGFDFGTEAMPIAPTSSSSPDARAEQILKDWEELRFPDGVETREAEEQQASPLTPLHILKTWPVKDLLKYWKEFGRRKYELLSKVVMACAATDGAAAEIERDWCVGSDVITSDRGSLDPAWFEMVMFLRTLWGGKECIVPDDLLPHLVKLTDNEAEAAIPRRLVTLEEQLEVADLDSEVEQEEEATLARLSGVAAELVELSDDEDQGENEGDGDADVNTSPDNTPQKSQKSQQSKPKRGRVEGAGGEEQGKSKRR